MAGMTLPRRTIPGALSALALVAAACFKVWFPDSPEAFAQGATVASPAPATAPASHSGRVAASRHRKATEAAKAVELPAAPAVPQIATPPPPDWPVNDKATPASVDWNGRVLSISATNSSLQQILSDVSTATGVKIEGTPSDQRVYGSYGPAPARDVLGQLLDGSGMNVMMIGDQGQGTPRTLVLTNKSSSPAPNPGANSQARQSPDEDAEEPEQPEQPDPVLTRPPGFARNPQQVREFQQRMQLQQQQQQQGTPMTPPPVPQPQER